MSDIKCSSPFPSLPPWKLLCGIPGEQLRHGRSGLTALIKPLIPQNMLLCQAREPSKPPREALMRERALTLPPGPEALGLHGSKRGSRGKCAGIQQAQNKYLWKSLFNHMGSFSKWDSFQFTGSPLRNDPVNQLCPTCSLRATCLPGRLWLRLNANS